jgi:hypothetical protein
MAKNVNLEMWKCICYLKPKPFKRWFSTSNFTSTLLNCFVLKSFCSKTKQLRSVLVKLLVVNKCLNSLGLIWIFLSFGYHPAMFIFYFCQEFRLVQPNEPDQPDPTQFGPWGPNPTWLNPNLDPGDPTRPEIGFKLGSFGFIKYIIELNPNLNPIWGQPDPIGPVFRPDSTWILGPKSGSTRKSGSGLAAQV